MNKRIFAFLLALVMVFQLVSPAIVSADDVTVPTSTQETVVGGNTTGGDGNPSTNEDETPSSDTPAEQTLSLGANNLLSAENEETVKPGNPVTISVNGENDTTVYLIADGFYQDGATLEQTTNLYITNKAGLESFRDLVNAKRTVVDSYLKWSYNNSTAANFYTENIFTNKTVHLLENIDLNNESWESIGYVHKAVTEEYYGFDKELFYGTFDGHNHTISNLKIALNSNNSKSEYGLFGRLGASAGQTIRDLTLKNVQVNSGEYVGAIVGNASTNAVTVSNCSVLGTVKLSGSYTGGLAGIGNLNVLNCTVTGNSESTISGYYAGGLVGAERCSSDLSVSENYVSDVKITGSQFVSTLLGAMATGASGNVSVTNNKVKSVSLNDEDVAPKKTDAETNPLFVASNPDATTELTFNNNEIIIPIVVTVNNVKLGENGSVDKNGNVANKVAADGDTFVAILKTAYEEANQTPNANDKVAVTIDLKSKEAYNQSSVAEFEAYPEATVKVNDSALGDAQKLTKLDSEAEVTFTVPFEPSKVIHYKSNGGTEEFLPENTESAANTFKVTQNGGDYDVTVSVQEFSRFVLIDQDDDTVAYNTNTRAQYSTLAAAVAAVPANGTETTITMLADDAVVAGVTVAAGQNIILELNGKTVSGNTDSTTTYALITNKGTLTIQDNTDTQKDGTGSGLITTYITNPDGGDIPGYASNTITNNGTLTVKSGKIVNNGNGYACYAIDNQTNGTLYTPVLNIEGGRMEQMNAYTYAVRMFANSTTNANTVNISGGVITGGYGLWLQTPNAKANKASLNITGGTFVANNGASLFIGGTKADNSNIAITISGGNVGGTGMIIYRPLSGEYGKVEVTGGEFENIQCGANVEHFISAENADPNEYNGPVFKNEPAAKYIVPTQTALARADGKYILAKAVAQIGDVKYATLANAVAAANAGETIKLLANIDLSNDPLTSGGYAEIANIMLDLNGHAITGGALDVYGTVTITDTSENANGSITGKKHGIWVNPNGALNVTGGTITTAGVGLPVRVESAALNVSGGTITNTTGSGAVYADGTSTITVTAGSVTSTKDDTYGIQIEGNSTAAISGGTVTGHDWGVSVFNTSTLTVSGTAAIRTAEGEGYAITTNGNADQKATINIQGGTIIGGDLGVYAPSGTLNISGGTITGATGVYFKSKNLSITGGTITGNGDKTAYHYNGNGANPTGDALVLDNCGYPNGVESYEVSGGTFVSEHADAVASYANTGRTPLVGFITGGLYSTVPVAAYIATGYVAEDAISPEGYYQIVKSTGTAVDNDETSYVSIPLAVKALVTNNGVKEITTGAAAVIGSVTIESGSKIAVADNAVKGTKEGVTVTEVTITKNKDSSTAYAVTTEAGGSTLATTELGNGMNSNANPSNYVKNVASMIADKVAASNKTVDADLEVDLKLDVVADKTKLIDNTVTYDVSLQGVFTVNGTASDAKKIANSELAKGASFTFKVKAPAGAKLANVVHRFDGGSETFENLEVDANGYVTITLTHFSEIDVTGLTQYEGSNWEDANFVNQVYMNLQDGLYMTYIVHVADSEAKYAVLNNGNAKYTIDLSSVGAYNENTFNAAMRNGVVTKGYYCAKYDNSWYYIAVSNYPNRMNNAVTLKLQDSSKETLTLYQNAGEAQKPTLYSVANDTFSYSMIAFLNSLTGSSNSNTKAIAETLLDYYTIAYAIYH